MDKSELKDKAGPKVPPPPFLVIVSMPTSGLGQTEKSGRVTGKVGFALNKGLRRRPSACLKSAKSGSCKKVGRVRISDHVFVDFASQIMTPLRTLYPPLEPYKVGFVDVGDGHTELPHA
jgi:hypothetical protein